jgi:hypothetical protein
MSVTVARCKKFPQRLPQVCHVLQPTGDVCWLEAMTVERSLLQSLPANTDKLVPDLRAYLLETMLSYCVCSPLFLLGIYLNERRCCLSTVALYRTHPTTTALSPHHPPCLRTSDSTSKLISCPFPGRSWPDLHLDLESYNDQRLVCQT